MNNEKLFQEIIKEIDEQFKKVFGISHLDGEIEVSLKHLEFFQNEHSKQTDRMFTFKETTHKDRVKHFIIDTLCRNLHEKLYEQ